MYRYSKLFILIMHLNLIATYAFTCQLGADRNSEIPDSIILKTDDFIRSEVGDEYFKEFVSFDTSKSLFRKSYGITHPTDCATILKESHYFLVYNITIPDIDENFVTIEFITDNSGDLISECYLDKIPDCPNNNCWNNFPVIKKTEAISIAKNMGLEDGIKDWIVRFHFDFEDLKDYVWDIKATLSKGGEYYGQGASGKGMFISAKDGAVIRRYGWSSIH